MGLRINEKKLGANHATCLQRPSQNCYSTSLAPCQRPYNTTEIISMETNVSKKGPDLPTAALIGHAMVKVDENNIYIIGGFSMSYKSFKSCLIYDQHSSEFTSCPEMNDARASFGWGIFSSSLHNDRPCLLVAGGNTSQYLELLTQVSPFTNFQKLYRQTKTMPIENAYGLAFNSKFSKA